MNADGGRFIDDERIRQVNIKLPLVSVIVTNYNYANYIGECLDSINNQDYENYECIIVDDNSTDDSVNIINQAIPNLDVPVKLIEHEENRGQFQGFQTGLKHSGGVFVVFVDADDVLLKDFISGHIKIHLGNYPVAFTSSNQYQINDTGELIAGTHGILQGPTENIVVWSQSLQYPFWPWATTSSMMFRRSILELILNDTDYSMNICADNYVCHFANLIAESIVISNIYGCYRRHRNNYFASNPYINNRTLIGNMDNHPEHKRIMYRIREELMERSDSFLQILSFSTYSKTVLRVTDIAGISGTILRLSKISGKNFFMVAVRLLLLYSIQTVGILGRILTRKTFIRTSTIREVHS